MWGFGLTALIAIGKVFNVPVVDSNIGTFVQILTTFLGIVGVRDAISGPTPASRSK
jgi:hypothetical protein